jgi:glutamate--cysteine ligase catalytic subunit
MGLLSEGEPLSWEETHKYADHVRQHGVEQFIHLYKKLNERKGDVLKWGDEIEYFVIKLDDDKKQARVSMRAEDLLERLQKPEREAATTNEPLKSLWRPEYSSYCIEGTPGVPYGGKICCFNEVEGNMRYRREEVEKLLHDDEILVSMSIFPRLGCNPFTDQVVLPGAYSAEKIFSFQVFNFLSPFRC